MFQVDPDVVRVEKAVAPDVLEGGQVLPGALGRLPQDEAAVAKAGEVPALFVGGGFLGDLHHEGEPVFSEVPQQGLVDPGAQVVRIADEGVAHTLVQEFLEHTGGVKRGIDIPVAGRVPLQLPVGRPADRRQFPLQDLGEFVLQKTEGRLRRLQLVERSQGGRVRVEAVHQGEPRVAQLGLAQEDFQKRAAMLDLEQGFRPDEPHGGPQPAVQHDPDGLTQHAPSGLRVSVKRRRHWNLGGGDRQDVDVVDEAGRAAHQLPVIMGEGVEHQRFQAGLCHLGGELLELGSHRLLRHRIFPRIR